MVIRCKVGKFEFDDQITLSMAKLIRSTVMGAILAPAPGDRKLKTTSDVEKFLKSAFKNHYHLVTRIELEENVLLG